MTKKVVILILTIFTPYILYTNSWPIDSKKVNLWLQYVPGFEPNMGQIRDQDGKPVRNIIFYTKFNGLNLFITDKGITFIIYKPEGILRNIRQINTFPNRSKCDVQYSRIDIDVLGTKIKKSKIVYEDELPGYTNYYNPQYPGGTMYVKSYGRVRIKNLYPGIDWIFEYKNGVLHHEFEVSKNADIRKIRLLVKYADVDVKDDKLILSTPLNKIEDGKLIGYAGKRKVDVNYKKSGNVIEFEVKNWTRKDALVIDPPLSLLWSTYYGGNDADEAYSIVTDQDGNIYITGATTSYNFPTLNPGNGSYFQGIISGGWDVFILKFSSRGERLWATYYGGSDNEWGNSIAVNLDGEIYVTGVTTSNDFPTYDPGNGAYYQGSSVRGYGDAFVLKFSSTGELQWATLYGGSDYDVGNSITIDNNGNIFITGQTWSNDFPTYDPGNGAYYQGNLGGGDQDAFVAKFNNSCSLVWATYYGGSGNDWGNSIVTDSEGNILLTGETWSNDFPTYDPGGNAYYQMTYGGNKDAFIAKFSNTGELEWATYYGGSGDDVGASITVDSQGNVFLTGRTNSLNFPTYYNGNGSYFQGSLSGSYDVFILKFNNACQREWATYYGGYNDDWGSSVTIDNRGNLFITGWTNSTNFPTYDPGDGAFYQEELAGEEDAFVLKFDNTGVWKWGTYIGGSNYDEAHAIITNNQDEIFITGYTGSTNFPTFNPGGNTFYQGIFMGYEDVFVGEFESSLVDVNEYPIDNGLLVVYNTILNPYSKITEIRFKAFRTEKVKVEILDVGGKIIKILRKGVVYPGIHIIRWDGTDEEGKFLENGIYFINIETKDFTKTVRLILLR